MHMTCSIPCQLAQPIRLLLKYTGTEFEDVFYEEGPRELMELASVPGPSPPFFMCNCKNNLIEELLSSQKIIKN